ncbi:MAG: ferritin-like domain-containing protein [Nannocystaceae bacterium]|nr:ferritin-like domain-containing protein [Nannocystaceae bacterium]
MSARLDLRGWSRALQPTLPDPDRLPQGLGPQVRAAAIATWRARMINEHGSAPVFEALAQQAAAAGLDATARELAGFAHEERHHGALCGAVVEALGGEAVATIEAPTPVPGHDEVAPIEALARNVISVCCMSETIAVALIDAERLQMPQGPLRTLLTAILADEVGHARAGWRLLASLCEGERPALDADARVRLWAYADVALEHQRAHQHAHLPLASRPPAAAAAWGLCDGASARTLCDDTIAHVIVPGLAARLGPAPR